MPLLLLMLITNISDIFLSQKIDERKCGLPHCSISESESTILPNLPQTDEISSFASDL